MEPKIKSKYNSLREFKLNEPKMYRTCTRKGWIEQLCKDTGWKNTLRVPRGIYTKEYALNIFQQFNTKTECRKIHPKLYDTISRGPFFKECTKHMEPTFNILTLEFCKEVALKYRYRSEWLRSKDKSSYMKALKMGWLEECCGHMIKLNTKGIPILNNKIVVAIN